MLGARQRHEVLLWVQLFLFCLSVFEKWSAMLKWWGIL